MATRVSHSAAGRVLSALAALCLLATLAPPPVAAIEPPDVGIRGPLYVPVGSKSPRLYVARAWDPDGTGFTRSLHCGAQAPTDFGDWYIDRQEWFTCSFNSAGTHHVGVRATDSQGAQAAALLDVVATTRVRSVADAHLVATGHAEERPFGGTLAMVDLNGDGKAELAIGVGRPRSQPQASGVRHVHVLFGRTAGGNVKDTDFGGSTGFKISGTADERDFGTSLADAGDVNGDGYRDIIIGSPPGEDGEGRAYVVFGRANMTSLTPATMAASRGFRITAPRIGSGFEVTGGRDINGDGYADVLVGTPYVWDGPSAVHVIYGKANPTDVNLANNPSTYGARLDRTGPSIAVGDVNGDKKADIVLGGSIARVVYGRSGLSGTVDVQNMPASVGFSISGLESHTVVATGDLNGDGKAEILATGNRDNDPYDRRSRVSIILGRSSFTSFDLRIPPSGGVFEVLMPRGEAAGIIRAGDWNGDARADLIIGARGADEQRGSAYIVPGKANLSDVKLEELGAWHRVDGDMLYASAGEGLAAGDFNGDKRTDIAVGSPWAITEDPDPFSFGRAGIFLGTGPVVDTTRPVAFPPSASLSSSIALTNPPTVRVSWPAATDNVGVVRYRLQYRINSGAWRNVALSSPTALTADVALLSGAYQHRFRVRAFDAAGNASTWQVSPAFEVRRLQEGNASIQYSGAFTRSALTGASKGYVRWSGKAGNKATLTFSGRSVAWVSTRGTRGIARVSVDGVLMDTVDLWSYNTRPAWIPVAYNLAPGKHTLTIEVRGTSNGASGNPRIDIDAFIVLK